MQNVQKSILQGECCPRMHCEMADDVREMLIITFFQYWKVTCENSLIMKKSISELN